MSPTPTPLTGPKAIQGKRFAIYGLGVTGQALSHFLLDRGAQVIVFDDAPADRFPPAVRESLLQRGAELVFQPTGHDWMRLLARTGALIPSPGIAVPRLILDIATQSQVAIVAELDLAGDHFPGAIVAITGTNGKSTISAWIHWLLREAGLDSRLGGNFGIPTVETFAGATDQSWGVWEVSSYQLADTQRFHPRIAVWSTLTPDHLQRHGSMEDYAAAKARIFARQGAGDTLLVNADDARLLDALERHPVAPGVVRLDYSLERQDGAAGLHEGQLWLRTGQGTEPLVPVEALPLPGRHNASNALAAALAAQAAGASPEAIRTHLVRFQGLPHRLEPVASVDELRWINDSKATNPESVLVALASFADPFHLVLGGSEKHLDYRELYTALDRHPVLSVTCMGPAGHRIAQELRSQGFATRVDEVRSLSEAVTAVRERAQAGEMVLVSPGAPSFNEFQNYEERGETLRRLVASRVPVLT